MRSMVLRKMTSFWLLNLRSNLRTSYLIIFLLLVSAICGADDLLRDAEIAQKQAEIALASSNIWLRLRWGIADWLPWLAGAGLLFAIWQWGLSRCPQCRRRFPKHISGRTVNLPTSSRSGTAIAKLQCRGCGHEWEVERSISRFRIPTGRRTSGAPGKRPSSSSRPFKGFGGGSSGGGGSTRGY